MAEAQYAHNHIINPATGYLENPAYSYDFDTEKKKAFLGVFYNNGLRLYRTADELGISHHTINKHYDIDAKFREDYDEVVARYTDELEGVSRTNALNPRSVIERIFQLKCLKPEKYAEQRNSGQTVVNLTLDLALINEAKKRAQTIDAEVVEEKAT